MCVCECVFKEMNAEMDRKNVFVFVYGYACYTFSMAAR